MRDDGQIQPAKVTHFTQQGYTITGVIHAGMNDGEEVYSYKDLGIKNILGFEPLPQAAAIARRDHGVEVVELALSNKNGKANFIVTGGDGKGSSLYDGIADHPEHAKWRDVDLIKEDTIKVTKMRFDYYVNNTTLDLSLYDCLVLDTQGNELDILKGMGEYLKDFKYLSIELSDVPVYKGEAPASEVCAWLADKGFTQDSQIQSHNDVFFIRSDIKPTSDLVYRGLA